MYKISLIIPTRERPTLFQKVIESLQINTKHPENLELLIIVNDDDITSQDYVKKVMSHHGMFKYRLLLRPYSRMLNEDYYNWASRQAIGDLIWIYADDLFMCAPNWDEMVEIVAKDCFQKYPDGIFCLGIMDNTKPPSHLIPKHPCFPMFPKQVHDAQGGWYLSPTIPTWGVDYIIYKIYSGINRLIWIKDRNYLNHCSHHTHQVPVDDTSNRIGATFNLLKMRPEFSTDVYIANEVPKVIKLLQEKIDNYGK